MPTMLTGERVPFTIVFRAPSPDGGVTPGPIAPIQSITWSVSDATAIRVDVPPGSDGTTGFVVAVGPNTVDDPADVLYDADADMGVGVVHITGKNAPDDRFVINQDPAGQAVSGALSFGPAEKVPA